MKDSRSSDSPAMPAALIEQIREAFSATVAAYYSGEGVREAEDAWTRLHQEYERALAGDADKEVSNSGAGEAVLCGYCGKPIEGSPVIGNGAPYHDGCWAEEGDF